jgi:hypothetical protein
MFIDKPHHNHQLRSEERNSTRFLPLKSIPLLRTEPVQFAPTGYRHLTPNGVKRLIRSPTPFPTAAISV